MTWNTTPRRIRVNVAVHHLAEVGEQPARREQVVTPPCKIRAGHPFPELDPADQRRREIDLLPQLVLGHPRGDTAPAQFRAEECEQARAGI
jgi:hypothetical protein